MIARSHVQLIVNRIRSPRGTATGWGTVVVTGMVATGVLVTGALTGAVGVGVTGALVTVGVLVCVGGAETLPATTTGVPQCQPLSVLHTVTLMFCAVSDSVVW